MFRPAFMAVLLILAGLCLVGVAWNNWPELHAALFEKSSWKADSDKVAGFGQFGDSYGSFNSICSAFAAVAVAGALLLQLIESRTGSRQKSAEYLVELVGNYSDDPDIRHARYLIEYSRFRYGPRFHGSKLEVKIDKMLDFYDLVGTLYMSTHLKLDDLEFIAYDVVVIYQDDSIQRYFLFLDKWFARRGMKTRPYNSFRRLAADVTKKYYRATA